MEPGMKTPKGDTTIINLNVQTWELSRVKLN